MSWATRPIKAVEGGLPEVRYKKPLVYYVVHTFPHRKFGICSIRQFSLRKCLSMVRYFGGIAEIYCRPFLVMRHTIAIICNTLDINSSSSKHFGHEFHCPGIAFPCFPGVPELVFCSLGHVFHAFQHGFFCSFVVLFVA